MVMVKSVGSEQCSFDTKIQWTEKFNNWKESRQELRKSFTWNFNALVDQLGSLGPDTFLKSFAIFTPSL